VLFVILSFLLILILVVFDNSNTLINDLTTNANNDLQNKMKANINFQIMSKLLFYN
jgi:hypothetical protein